MKCPRIIALILFVTMVVAGGSRAWLLAQAPRPTSVHSSVSPPRAIQSAAPEPSNARLRYTNQAKVELVAEQVLDQSQTSVGPAGGSASLGRFARVSLPEAASRPTLSLSLQKIVSAHHTLLYTSESVGAGPSLTELLKITNSENMTTSVAVTLQVPPAFASNIPAGHSVELFALISQIEAGDDRISTFRQLGAAYDPIRGVASASVPPHAFAPSNSVTTYILIGSRRTSG